MSCVDNNLVKKLHLKRIEEYVSLFYTIAKTHHMADRTKKRCHIRGHTKNVHTKGSENFKFKQVHLNQYHP